jgi:hypothetical protein
MALLPVTVTEGSAVCAQTVGAVKNAAKTAFLMGDGVKLGLKNIAITFFQRNGRSAIRRSTAACNSTAMVPEKNGNQTLGHASLREDYLIRFKGTVSVNDLLIRKPLTPLAMPRTAERPVF